MKTKSISIFIILCLVFSSLALAGCAGTPGGGKDVTVRFFADGKPYAEITYAPADGLRLPPDPPKEGMEFAGWYYDDGVRFSADDPRVPADVYAKWVVPGTLNHIHSYGEWEYATETTHEKTCACGDTVTENHTMAVQEGTNENGMKVTRCTACGYETYGYPWENETVTELKMWLGGCDDSEWVGGGYALLAGGTYDDNSFILTYRPGLDGKLTQAVLDRNNALTDLTNIKIKYVYDGSQRWGNQSLEISKQISAGAPDAPDMIYGFVVDLMRSQLSGVFNNLNGSPYFAFNRADYDAEKDDGGYYFRYMDSLTLSTKGRFLLASDYTPDILRCCEVCPVSEKLLKQTGLTPDGFLSLVKENKFTWSLITDMTAGNAQKGITGVGTDGVDGDLFSHENEGAVFGMLLSNKVSVMTAIAHSTPDTFLTRAVRNGEYCYSYNDGTNFTALSCGLMTFMDSSPFIQMAQRNSYYELLGDEAANIKEAFSDERVLVGGIVKLGTLEEKIYRNMKGEGKGGFIAAPLPLLREGDEYRTVVENTAAVIAVSGITPFADRCAAYLDCAASHSGSVVDAYLDFLLQTEKSQVYVENAAVIRDMRSCLGYAFGQIADDLIEITGQDIVSVSPRGEEIHVSLSYHKLGVMLRDNYKKGVLISDVYGSVKNSKQTAIGNVQKTFISACGN